MFPADHLVNKGNWCFAKEGALYVVYIPDNSNQPTLDLTGYSGNFIVTWYHPSSGRFIDEQTLHQPAIKGGSIVRLKIPKDVQSLDWAALIEREKESL